MRAIHPGEILREDFLPGYDMSPNALAQALRVPATRIHAIVNEKRAITADTALRLGRLFATGPDVWMNLQAKFDLRKAEIEFGEIVEHDVRPIEQRHVG
ncbi:HigA family addiction module antitoxin [Dyella thiooxydans]|uniref:HigA family addiction module antitoxin n=1 Tax=Dyella thiooxydans TaxID=445710 RepID=UPI001F000F55|nr:HigA family addiction module antitoxin [Dyella thiooxydans]